MGEKNNKIRLLRVLFRKYRVIRQTCDEQILERYRQEEEYYESFEWFARLMEGKDPDRLIEDLQQTTDRTERIIAHIERTVEEYGSEARQEDLKSWRGYDALYSKYFSTTFSTPKEISKKFGVKKSVIYKDLRHAETRLITMLFEGSPSGEPSSQSGK